MLRSFLTWLSVLTTTVLLAACCGSKVCDCDDRYADAIGFRFTPISQASPNSGFAARDIDTVFIIRMPLDTTQLLETAKADTVQVVRLLDSVYTRPVVINNATPFALATGRKLSDYRFRLYVAKTQRSKTPSFYYDIEQVQLNTKYETDGCCTCFQNSNKLVTTVDQKGNRQQLNLTDATGANKLIPITLVRP